MTSQSAPSAVSLTAYTLPTETTLGRVSFKVRDLAAMIDFYTTVLGMEVIDRQDERALLGAGGQVLLELVQVANAVYPGDSNTGLYHAAFLLPSRADLARFVRHLVETGVQFGYSDHLVSEAFYLNDVEGNGLEVYRDRPRSEWKWQGNQVAMANAEIDFKSFFAEITNDPIWRGMPAGSRLGHMHLKIGDIARARTFYNAVFGFDVVAYMGGSALFVSAGGYHHHVGLNVWHSRGGQPAPANATGLNFFEVVLPTPEAREALVARLREAGVPLSEHQGAPVAHDPWDNRLVLVVANP
jgi:catechol 2,3-dioxygenase